MASLMSDDHKKKLDDNRVDLVKTVVIDKMWSYLRQKGVLEDCDESKIKLNKTREEQIEAFLDVLKRGKDFHFDAFCDCLVKTNQEHVAGLLRPNTSQVSNDEVRGAGAVGQQPIQPSTSSQGGHVASAQTPSPSPLYTDIYEADENPEDFEKMIITKSAETDYTQQYEIFKRKGKKEIYQMNKANRGPFLIVNVQKVEGFDDRQGTDIDCRKLQHLSTQLNFIPTVLNDEDGLKAEQIKKKVKGFAELVPQRAQACVICLLSHGYKDHILGTDGEKVSIKEILQCLIDQPSLKGKPKILILQACRREIDEPDSPKDEDTIICYPTLEGFKAWRNHKRGSIYIGWLFKVFMEKAHELDIMELLSEVKSQVVKQIKENEQTPEAASKLIKNLYFFPGITKD